MNAFLILLLAGVASLCCMMSGVYAEREVWFREPLAKRSAHRKGMRWLLFSSLAYFLLGILLLVQP